MGAISKNASSNSFRIGLLELAIVLAGLIFVRKEVYLAGQFKSMILCWQEYALLILVLVDGLVRGYFIDKNHNTSPLRNHIFCYVLALTLFLFVSCSSLCDKLNVACIHMDWFRDVGLIALSGGIALFYWTESSRPKEYIHSKLALSTESTSSVQTDTTKAERPLSSSETGIKPQASRLTCLSSAARILQKIAQTMKH